MQVIIADTGTSRSYALNFSVLGMILTGIALVLLGAGGMYAYRAEAMQLDRQLLEQQRLQQQALQSAMEQNMADMARKVGELQAKLVQLHHLSDRVVELADLPDAKKAKSPHNTAPGQGGALVSARPAQRQELLQVMDRMDVAMTAQTDFLLFAEAQLFDLYLSRKMIPTQEPVPGGRLGSPFGRRIDPINGSSAMHTGLDFQALTGTPIYAAAGGVVITNQYHAAYGNMLEIDHGNELVTRYAHASELLVSRGDVVKRGQMIARVGSTGRSTGPHLHFEVLVQGTQQNPQKFLDAGSKANWREILAAKSK